MVSIRPVAPHSAVWLFSHQGVLEIQVESSDAGSSHGEHRHLDFHPIQLDPAQRVTTVASVEDNVEQSGNPRATISHSAPSTDPYSRLHCHCHGGG